MNGAVCDPAISGTGCNYVEGSTMLGENIALKLKYRPEISLRLPTFAAQNVTRKTYNVKRQE
jgi:hypothetical protein